MINQFDFDCKFRSSDNSPCVCKYQSLKLGHIVKTSSLFCNNECPESVYKYGQDDTKFLIKCFNRRYDSIFLDKVISKYNKSTKLIVPNIWSNIYNNLYYLLKQESWFVDIGLTGSIIVDGVTNQKDIDIVIGINNIDDYILWSKTNILPKYINNLKTDYYFYLKLNGSFFLSLWPNQKIVYCSALYKHNISYPIDYKVIYYDNVICQLLRCK